jgi:L-fuconolactonase
MVDSQCHVSPIWYEPVESLLEQMLRNEVEQAVLVQMLGQVDNSYQQSCLKRYPGRFASVVLIDLEASGCLSQLQRLAEAGATGLRLRPTARSPGADALAVWRAAADLQLAVSCVGNSAAFCSADFARLLGSIPQLTVVLEHLGGAGQPDASDFERSMRLKVMELARFPNVYLKVPGLGELHSRISPADNADGPFRPELPESLERALQTFGPRRLMWGSDFPVVCSREGYGNSVRLCRDALRSVSTPELDEIFGGVARRVFKLAPAAVAV